MSRSFGGRLLTTRSPIRISPAVIFSSPAIMRSSVDLPQPDGPTSTTNSPSPMRYIDAVDDRQSCQRPCARRGLRPKPCLIPPKDPRVSRFPVLARGAFPPVFMPQIVLQRTSLNQVSSWLTISNRSCKARGPALAFHRAGGQARRQVAAKCVIDRGRRQCVNEARRHQQFPWRVVGGQKVAEGDG